MTTQYPAPASPKWGPTTKLVVGLTIVALVIALLIQFRSIVGPLILAFILAYALHPLITRLTLALKLPWRTAVSLIYLLLLVLLVGLVTLSGFAVIQQLQSLYGFIQNYVTNLPAIVDELSQQVYVIGPFEFDLRQFDLPTLANQLLGVVQPLLGRAGGLLSTLAASAAVTLGWLLFVLVISYFLLADTSRVSHELVQVEIPGYDYDLRRLNQELRKIWNAFLRGQIIIIILVIITYTVLMTVLGMRFALGIAVLAGLGRFVPYLGPLVLWVVTGLVAFFQGGNYFGLEPFQYSILVLVVAVITDQVFDNIVTPRFLGQTLGVHPAAVLVAAIIAARLIGLIGLVLAAPSLATLSLIGRYVVRKMFDLEPFPEKEPTASQPEEPPWARGTRRLRAWWRVIQKRG
jgi:predicted PurR-regulated permease PerM